MSTYQNFFNPPPKNNNNSENLVIAILIVIVLSVLFSFCSPTKKMDKAYKTVSTDPAPASEPRKAQLSGWVAANFPIREITKDSISTKIVLDTSRYADFRAAIKALNERSTNCPELNADSIFILAAEAITPSTIITERWRETKVKDTVGNWLQFQEKKMLQDIANDLKAELNVSEMRNNYWAEQNKKAVDELSAEKNKRNKWLWYFIASIAVLIITHWLRSTIKIPFL